MYAFCINKLNVPIGICAPDAVRHLFKNKDVPVISKSPLIIKIKNEDNVGIKKYPLVMNLNITFLEVVFNIFYKDTIFYSTTLKSNNINNIKGLFLLLYDHIKLNKIEISINSSKMCYIDLPDFKCKYLYSDNKSIESNIVFADSCIYCNRELSKDLYKIYHIIPDKSFLGNDVFICYNCSKRFLNKEENNYILLIQNMYKLYEEISGFIKSNLVKEN